MTSIKLGPQRQWIRRNFHLDYQNLGVISISFLAENPHTNHPRPSFMLRSRNKKNRVPLTFRIHSLRSFPLSSIAVGGGIPKRPNPLCVQVTLPVIYNAPFLPVRMSDYELVSQREAEEKKKKSSNTRIASLDIFRGLSVFVISLSLSGICDVWFQNSHLCLDKPSMQFHS